MARRNLRLAAAFAVAVGAQEPGPLLELHLFPERLAEERGARCLDHSPAGYYIREQDPRRWVVFLEGGGLCIETADCIYRAAKTHFGSSSFWQWNATPEGNHMLTSTLPLNPFANWSHVYVPYCSGDTWLGNSKDGHVVLFGLQMSGHLILATVLERLGNTTAIANATDVVFGGTSAGGIGVYHHIDWFADTIGDMARRAGAPPPRVAGFPVEGIFFPKDFPVLFPEWVFGVRATLEGLADKWITGLFSPTWLHPACSAAARAEGFDEQRCFDISFMYRFIRTPLFLMTNLFDKLMIHDLGACLACSAQTAPTSLAGQYIRFFGDLMEQTVQDIRAARPDFGVFATAEYHHDENFVGLFTTREKRIDGTALREAIERWYWQQAPTVLLEPRCINGGPCPDDPNQPAYTGGDEPELGSAVSLVLPEGSWSIYT